MWLYLRTEMTLVMSSRGELSGARGTATDGISDVDVIAEFDPTRRLSLLDIVAIENRLAEVLGMRVDLSPVKTLKEPVLNKAS